MSFQVSGTDQLYLPTWCVCVLSGEGLGQYITYSEVLREFKQTALFLWFNKQLVLTSCAVSSCFYSTANVEFIYFTMKQSWSTVPYHPCRSTKSILMDSFYESIDAQVTYCPLSCSCTWKKVGEMEISLISVKDKVSSTKELSALLNFEEKFSNRPFSSSNQVS